MEHISIKSVVADLAQQLVVDRGANPKFERRRAPPGAEDKDYSYFGIKGGYVGVYFRINVVADNHGYEKDGRTYREDWVRTFRRTIHIIVTSRHNVFTCVTGMGHPGIPKPEMWENPSNHDSCWKEDGLRVIDNVFWDAYEACWSHVSNRNRPAPKDLSTFTAFDWLGLKGKAYDYVVVYGESAEDHRYKLTEISVREVEEVKLKEPEPPEAFDDEPAPTQAEAQAEE